MGAHRIVIIGSGFGGLFATRALKKSDVDITLISRTSHHLFQPLLYQVATGILSEGEIAPSTREILKKQSNAQVLLGEVENIDTANKIVYWRFHNDIHTTSYDTLIIAAGVGQSYFGNQQFATFAPGMKSIDDALELRARIFHAFELAEMTENPEKAKELMTFVVVGAGPTGVEMAGQIRELSSKTLRNEFTTIDPTSARVILVDGSPIPLKTFGEDLGRRAKKSLEKIGVELLMESRVTNVDADSVTVTSKTDGSTFRIPTFCKVWAAGVEGSPLGKVIAKETGAKLDRSGRVQVNSDLTLPDHPEIFVIGDLASIKNVPGVAQGAIQGARFVCSLIKNRLDGKDTSQSVFKYHDKGSMATIARAKAIVSMGKIKLSGFPAWVAWSVLHIFYLVGFKTRLSTLIHWFISFLSGSRSERTVTNLQLVGRLAVEKLGPQACGKLTQGLPLEGEITQDNKDDLPVSRPSIEDPLPPHESHSHDSHNI